MIVPNSLCSHDMFQSKRTCLSDILKNRDCCCGMSLDNPRNYMNNSSLNVLNVLVVFSPDFVYIKYIENSK